MCIYSLSKVQVFIYKCMDQEFSGEQEKIGYSLPEMGEYLTIGIEAIVMLQQNYQTKLVQLSQLSDQPCMSKKDGQINYTDAQNWFIFGFVPNQWF